MRFEFGPSASGSISAVPLFPEEFAEGILSLPELTVSPELTADAVIEQFGTGALGGKLNFLGDGLSFTPGSKLYSGGASMHLTLLFREDRLRSVTLAPRRYTGLDVPDEQDLEQCLAFLAPLFEGVSRRYYWGSAVLDEAAGAIVLRYL